MANIILRVFNNQIEKIFMHSTIYKRQKKFLKMEYIMYSLHDEQKLNTSNSKMFIKIKTHSFRIVLECQILYK